MSTQNLENRQHVSRAFRFSAINQIVNRIATFSSGIIIMRILSPLIGSTFFFLIVFAAAPTIGSWLNDENLGSALRLLSFAILIDGIGTIPLALLTRSMRQKRILAIETFSLVVQIVVTITLAKLDFGPNALVWGMIVSNGLSAGLMFVSAPEASIPGFHYETIKKLLKFSSPIALSNLFRVATMGADNLVVSAMQGPKQLGFYQLGYNGGNLPENTIGATIGRVSFAWFSEIRDNYKHRQKAFHDLTLGLVATTLPFVVFLSVMAEDIVRVLYGDKWIPAIEIVRILAFLGGLRVFMNFFADIFAAIGKPILELRVFVIWFTALLPSLIVGTHLWGIVGAAFAHIFVSAVIIIPIVVRNLVNHDFPVKTTAKNSIIFVVGAICQAIASYSISKMIDQPFISLVLAGSVGGLVFILVTFYPLNSIRKSFTRADHGFDQALEE